MMSFGPNYLGGQPLARSTPRPSPPPPFPGHSSHDNAIEEDFGRVLRAISEPWTKPISVLVQRPRSLSFPFKSPDASELPLPVFNFDTASDIQTKTSEAVLAGSTFDDEDIYGHLFTARSPPASDLLISSFHIAEPSDIQKKASFAFLAEPLFDEEDLRNSVHYRHLFAACSPPASDLPIPNFSGRFSNEDNESKIITDDMTDEGQSYSGMHCRQFAKSSMEESLDLVATAESAIEPLQSPDVGVQEDSGHKSSDRTQHIWQDILIDLILAIKATAAAKNHAVSLNQAATKGRVTANPKGPRKNPKDIVRGRNAVRKPLANAQITPRVVRSSKAAARYLDEEDKENAFVTA